MLVLTVYWYWQYTDTGSILVLALYIGSILVLAVCIGSMLILAVCTAPVSSPQPYAYGIYFTAPLSSLLFCLPTPSPPYLPSQVHILSYYVLYRHEPHKETHLLIVWYMARRLWYATALKNPAVKNVKLGFTALQEITGKQLC